MTESGDTKRDIKEMKSHLRNIDNKQDRILVSDPAVRKRIRQLFEEDENLRKVFLEIDGEKTQEELAEAANVSEATVSRRIKELNREGLIWKKEHNGGLVYKRDSLCRTLRLDEKVTEDGWED